MDDDELFTIGWLSRRTGMPVRTIRYWSDIGALPPAGRSEGGYRLYDAGAVARLELIKTLRELGVDLDDVRRVLERLEAGLFAEADRYRRLMAVINGREPAPSHTEDYAWLLAALKAHP